MSFLPLPVIVLIALACALAFVDEPAGTQRDVETPLECGSQYLEEQIPSSHSYVYRTRTRSLSITALEYAAYRPPRPHERASTLGDTEGPERVERRAARVGGGIYASTGSITHVRPPVIFPDTPHSRSPEDANMSMHM
jgi:hypothetical protein